MVVPNLRHPQLVGFDALALTAALVVRLLKGEFKIQLFSRTALHRGASRIKTRLVVAARRGKTGKPSFLHSNALLFDLFQFPLKIITGVQFLVVNF